MTEQFDFIIVGAGSAGAVLAARLSENPQVSVCLLEAGGPDTNPLIHVPAGFVAMVPLGVNNWSFDTVPQPGLKGRKGYQPRGKTLGGSSSINAMLYVRGHPSDYDDWEALGNPGWSWSDCLPYFRKAENNEVFDDAWHARGGPLNVAALRHHSPVSLAFLKACEQLGLPQTSDFNGEQQEGAGFYQVTQKDGERCSTAKAYLTPNLDRPNLTVITHATVRKVLFSGKRATGICFVQDGEGGVARTFHVNREIILSAGAFGTPQILLLSGVGDGQTLNRQGLPTVHHLPGVGKNLQDHIDYTECIRSKNKGTVGLSASGAGQFFKAWREYKKSKSGLFTSPFAEAGGFFRTHASLDRPNVQIHFAIGMVDNHARTHHLGHGYSSHVCVLRPKSRGSVSLASTNPFASPLIDPQFLSEEADVQTLLAGYRLQMRILGAPAFDEFRGEPLYGKGLRSDANIIDHIRSKADTVYHPVGSCKMGPDSDPMAVVDANLRVRGLLGLRIADASIMPTLVGGNTNAPTIMIAERAAAMILGSDSGKIVQQIEEKTKSTAQSAKAQAMA